MDQPTTTTKTTNQPQQIENEWKRLIKCSKDWLKTEVKRHRRVCDLGQCSKYDLANMILTDRHGARAVDAWASIY